MRRTALIWLAFAACIGVALAAIAYVSATAVALERAEREARARAAFEEKVRLALWRMDSALATFVAVESATPVDAYGAQGPGGIAPGQLPDVLLRFEISPAGAVTTQTTAGKVGVSTGRAVTPLRAVPSETLAELQGLDRARILALIADESSRYANAAREAEAAWRGANEARMARTEVQQVSPEQRASPSQAEQLRFENDLQQVASNAGEWRARQSNVESNITAQQAIGEAPFAGMRRGGQMTPVWEGSRLLLVRSVARAAGQYVQGCVLNWGAMKLRLLRTIGDLLPDADLVPVEPGQDADASRALAAIPAVLSPGTMTAVPGEAASPVIFALAVAWISAITACVSALALLWGALALSARRGAFVSAVTHELRTPLTTFLMYTEMLSGEMVPAEKRMAYLETLRAEAERLSHLVENVLAYSRLEGNSAKGRVEAVALSELVERACGRLRERAAQAGMELVCDAGAAAGANVLADRSAVERILFNLVDNACKYASPAADRRIHVEATADARCAMIRVRDHGPGISARDARRLFHPFSKSAADAANSAPGVGLGLALSKRLAQSLGGDLTLEASPEGASFVLKLRSAPHAIDG